MKRKTKYLTGAALDWAVAKCEGRHIADIEITQVFLTQKSKGSYNYSADWAQGGPIIERECINLIYRHPNFTGLWTAFNDEWDDDKNGVNCGDTPLIAAMRCYVASKIGDEVDVPEELQ